MVTMAILIVIRLITNEDTDFVATTSIPLQRLNMNER